MKQFRKNGIFTNLLLSQVAMHFMADTDITKADNSTGDSDAANRVTGEFVVNGLSYSKVTFTHKIGTGNDTRNTYLDIADGGDLPAVALRWRIALDNVTKAAIGSVKNTLEESSMRDIPALASIDKKSCVVEFEVPCSSGKILYPKISVPYCPDLSKFAAFKTFILANKADLYFSVDQISAGIKVLSIREGNMK